MTLSKSPVLPSERREVYKMMNTPNGLRGKDPEEIIRMLGPESSREKYAFVSDKKIRASCKPLTKAGKKREKKEEREEAAQAARRKENERLRTSGWQAKQMLEDLGRSGLTAEDADASFFRPLIAATMETETGLSNTSAYEIPYFGLDGSSIEFSRYRILENPFSNRDPDPHAPEENFDDEEVEADQGWATRKYHQKKGSGNHPYFSPLLEQDWRGVAADERVPLVIVEGEKKAALLCKHKIPAVGLSGVASWHSKEKKIALLPELTQIKWKGRPVSVCFDSSPQVNINVSRAAYRLGTLLIRLGAAVHIVELPAFAEQEQTGPDDFIVIHGVPAYQALLQATSEWKGFDLNDVGNAQRFAHLHGGDLHFVARSDSDSGTWYIWNEQFWEKDPKLVRQLYAQEMYKDMLQEALARNATTEELKSISSICSAPRISSAIKLARAIPPIPVRQGEFDETERTELLLNTPNGTIELPSKKGSKPVLRDARREDLITLRTNAIYDENAKAPRWEKFVLEHGRRQGSGPNAPTSRRLMS